MADNLAVEAGQSFVTPPDTQCTIICVRNDIVPVSFGQCCHFLAVMKHASGCEGLLACCCMAQPRGCHHTPSFLAVFARFVTAACPQTSNNILASKKATAASEAKLIGQSFGLDCKQEASLQEAERTLTRDWICQFMHQ